MADAHTARPQGDPQKRGRWTALRGATALALAALASPAAAADLDGLDSAARRWADGGAGGTPSFTRHVVPLFNKVGCSSRSCHGSFQGQAASA